MSPQEFYNDPDYDPALHAGHEGYQSRGLCHHPDHDRKSEPQTEAGRALVELGKDEHFDPEATRRAVLAIEDQAVAAYLASPARVEDMTLAEEAAVPCTHFHLDDAARVRCRWERTLAALRDQRGAS